jgi:hypothetical protein
LADRCRPAELAPVAVTLCGRKTCIPRESDAFRLTGHITGAGTLHGQSPGRHSDPPLEGSLCRCDVQRRCACKNIPGIVKAIPGPGENRSPSRRNRCSPSARNPVRLHPGIVFTIAPESFSPCSGIRILFPNMTLPASS